MSAPARRLGPKAALFFAVWTLGIFALAARGALKGSRPIPAYWPIPEFRLTAVTAAGAAELGRGDLLGRPWIANFIFTSCEGPCPLLSQKMAELQESVPEPVLLVSLSVDPDRDDVEALKRYARSWGARPERWIFLRGPKPTLYKLIFEGFKQAVAEDPKAPSGYRVTHSTRFALVDRDGVVRGLYEQDDLDALRRDVRALAKEALNG